MTENHFWWGNPRRTSGVTSVVNVLCDGKRDTQRENCFGLVWLFLALKTEALLLTKHFVLKH